MKDLLNKLEAKQNMAYAYIRIFLGMALAIRGVILISNPDKMSVLVSEEHMYLGYAVVAMVHLVGGVFLAIGFYPRLASLLLIPVLLGAVFVVHAGEGLMTAGQSLELAVMVLFLLVVYAVFGPGPLAITRNTVLDQD
ncbi:MAG TPA: DoxX family protein [Flavobacteriales bacterium]|nr:DoxX family protein [Flavobacteriales bacterium]